MFDANAAHIKFGEKFFAEVHCDDKQLNDMGIKSGDIVLCSHVSVYEKHPRITDETMIWTSLDSEPKVYKYDPKSGDWSWLVYSGRPNGKGFICDKWKAKALEFMNGNFEE